MNFKNFGWILFILLPFTAVSQQLTIKTDGVKINFLADMHKTKGTIGGFEAKITFDRSNLSIANISGSVKVNTLDTGTKKRDEHLKSSDYFDAEKYPKMTFKSTSIVAQDGKFIMTGKMKIKDVEREETIIFTFKENVFVGTTTIQAAHYKIGEYAKKNPDKTNVQIKFEIPVL